jgi:methyl-accepting chemotaxis protein
MSEEMFRWVISGGVAISTLCILVMAVVCMVMLRMVSKVRTKVHDVATQVEPVIDTVRRMAIENAPKVSDIADRAREIAANAKDMSDVAREQAHKWAEVSRDVADRTKAQVARVDAAVDETVDQVHHAGDNVKAAVMKPVREASGVIAGIRAAVTSYSHGRRPSIDHITQDEEMFI